jgi:hypothetical protein
MNNPKKRDRVCIEQVSPPSKMSKNNQPSNSDLMEQLSQLVASNVEVMKKIDLLEKRFDKVEKLVEEIDKIKVKIARMSQPIDSFKRFEIEQKKNWSS